MTKFYWSCAITAVFALQALDVCAEPAPARPLPAHRIVWSNLFALRLNPLGIEDKLELEYRLRLYDNPGLLWRDAYAGLALSPSISPSETRLGGHLTIKPIALLTLSAGYYYLFWHGTFGHLHSYSDRAADFSDSAIKKTKNDGYATTGHELYLKANVAAKAGPIALNNGLEFYRSVMNLHSGDRFYYQVRYDVLVENEGWMLANDTDLVFISDFGLVAGVRNSLVHSFLPGNDKQDNTPIDRLGPLLAYVFFDDPGSGFNKPTALLVLGWWLKNRFRTGEDVSQAMPYIVIGFKCEGDLWGS